MDFSEPITRIVYGLPGTGKSFIGVLTALELLQQGRTVYTNLPLRYRVFVAYCRLRKIEPRIKLIDDEFLHAFFERSVLRRRHHDRARCKPGYRYSTTDREFVEKHGPDTDANWVPAHTVLIIDEAHIWFPMQSQSKEMEHVQAFLTLHRHYGISVVAMTQDPMQVSITFRRLCREYTNCIRVGERGWHFIRLKHLGLDGTLYVNMSREQYDASAKSSEVGEYLDRRLIVRGWPTYQYVYRLYRPYMALNVRNRKRSELITMGTKTVTAVGSLCIGATIGLVLGSLQSAPVKSSDAQAVSASTSSPQLPPPPKVEAVTTKKGRIDGVWYTFGEPAPSGMLDLADDGLVFFRQADQRVYGWKRENGRYVAVSIAQPSRVDPSGASDRVPRPVRPDPGG